MFFRFILPGFLVASGLYALWVAYYRPYEIHNDYDQTRRRNLRITAWSVLILGTAIAAFFIMIGHL